MGYRFKNVVNVCNCFETIRNKQRAQLAAATTAASLRVHAHAVRVCPYKTGNLRRSISLDLVESSPTRVVVAIGTDVEYAPWLEFGTSRMTPRPYLRPALELESRGVVRDLHTAIRAMLHAGARGGR
jgi:HK97 gp10 family phage protein